MTIRRVKCTRVPQRKRVAIPPACVDRKNHAPFRNGEQSLPIAGDLAGCRANLIPRRYLRGALICVLAGGELMRYYTDRFHFPDQLPLNLCNITAWIAAIACLTLAPIAAEFTYFAGFVGAGMALITPDMGSVWHTRFFVNHGAIIVAGSVLVFGRLAPLRKGAVWRAYGFFALYIGLVGLFDWKYGANYAYLDHKPGTGTLLSLFGPWPCYFFAAGAVALALFWLLWLPARPVTSRSSARLTIIRECRRIMSTGFST
jgi:hypothetical integral membrane protein (TIGR02206 family)